MFKRKNPEPTPKSYRYVLTHSKFYEYENNRWYFLSSFVLYLIALETGGRYLNDANNMNVVVGFITFVLFLAVIVFTNDYIFYRIAKRKKK